MIFDRDWRSHCGPRSGSCLVIFADLSFAEHCRALLSSVSKAEKR